MFCASEAQKLQWVTAGHSQHQLYSKGAATLTLGLLSFASYCSWQPGPGSLALPSARASSRRRAGIMMQHHYCQALAPAGPWPLPGPGPRSWSNTGWHSLQAYLGGIVENPSLWFPFCGVPKLYKIPHRKETNSHQFHCFRFLSVSPSSHYLNTFNTLQLKLF